MRVKLGRLYRIIDNDLYCYFAKYVGSRAIVEVREGYLPFSKGDILQIICKKVQKPCSTISQDAVAHGNYAGKIVGAGTLEDIVSLFKGELEEVS